jgi:hypothetical protein
VVCIYAEEVHRNSIPANDEKLPQNIDWLNVYPQIGTPLHRMASNEPSCVKIDPPGRQVREGRKIQFKKKKASVLS